jgi:hypothetical protein
MVERPGSSWLCRSPEPERKPLSGAHPGGRRQPKPPTGLSMISSAGPKSRERPAFLAMPMMPPALLPLMVGSWRKRQLPLDLHLSMQCSNSFPKAVTLMDSRITREPSGGTCWCPGWDASPHRVAMRQRQIRRARLQLKPLHAVWVPCHSPGLAPGLLLWWRAASWCPCRHP